MTPAAGLPATVFFVPGCADDPAAAEELYAELRERSEREAGHALRPRRIRRLHCRLEGRDRVLEVGGTEAIPGQTITAIFEVDRRSYSVHVEAAGEDGQRGTLIVEHGLVYEATDFDV